jgi:uncharacterized protein
MRAGAQRALGICACASLALLASCAGQPDHFYALSTVPDAAHPPASSYSTHVILTVSLPALVDRRQMVLGTSRDQVVILEHERWAAPLPELAAQTLARDIEQRRVDVLVGDRTFDRSGVPPIRVRVDIVQMSAHKGGNATLEAHWRIVDPAAKSDEVGGETFEAPLGGEDYAAVARAFSSVLGSLADRLVAKLPSR